jgi:hypothetical protein
MEPPGGSVLTQEAGTVWSEMSKYHEAHEEHEGKKYFFKIRCSFHYPIFVYFAPFVVNRLDQFSETSISTPSGSDI